MNQSYVEKTRYPNSNKNNGSHLKNNKINDNTC